jgi:hypothetical protein
MTGVLGWGGGVETLVSGLSALRAAGRGRTQAVGSGFGEVFLFGSFWGDLLRQCESLMTRFLGAVATCTSSSILLCTGGCFALLGRSGKTASTILGIGVAAGFGLGLSSTGRAFGVEGSLGEGAAFASLSDAEHTALSAPASASSSSCHFLILSLTLAGRSIPIAFPKSLPFIVRSLRRVRSGHPLANGATRALSTDGELDVNIHGHLKR